MPARMLHGSLSICWAAHNKVCFTMYCRLTSLVDFTAGRRLVPLLGASVTLIGNANV